MELVQKGGVFGPYNAESGLGFMRVVQLYNVLTIVMSFIALLFISGRDVRGAAAFSAFNMALNMVCMGEIIWLISHRKRYTRQIAIVMYGVMIVSSLVAMWLAGDSVIDTVVGAVATPLLFMLYFAVSRRARAVLVQPFDVRFHDKTLGKTVITRDMRSSEFWMRLLIYFFAFSIMGHWMEMGVQVLVVHGIMPGTVAAPDSLTWRDYLTPFPIYGIAVSFCGLALYPLYLKLKDAMPKMWQAYLVSFLVNTAFCVIAELILGFLVNGDHQAWDYSNQFMNFQGQICLLYTVCFGIASSAITWFIYPLMERQFSYVSKEAFRVIFVGALVLYLFIVVTYFIDLYDLGLLQR